MSVMNDDGEEKASGGEVFLVSYWCRERCAKRKTTTTAASTAEREEGGMCARAVAVLLHATLPHTYRTSNQQTHIHTHPRFAQFRRFS